MNIHAIIEHALSAKEQAVKLTLTDSNGGLSVYEFLQAQKSSFCKTSEEEKAWDIAFLHGEEGEQRVFELLEESEIAE